VKSKTVTTILLIVGIPLLSLPCHSQSEAVSFRRQGNTIRVAIGGRPFTIYNFDPKTAKAYLQPLRSANGVMVTRGFPIGDTVPAANEHDPNLEPHQRAMYFAHGNINGFDFWGEEVFLKYYGDDDQSAFGRMVFEKIDEARGGPSSGTIRATFNLEGPDRKPFAEEVQQFTFSGDRNSRVIDCEFIVKALQGPVKFGDTKEGTFAIRLAPDLDAPTGTMISSAGSVGEPQIWGKRADWVDVDGLIDEQSVGVAIFDSPKSFRHPTYWHARGYGLLAANPFGLKAFFHDAHQDGSYTIPAGSSIKFRYRVFIHDGSYTQAHVADQYREYAATENGGKSDVP
jgi:Methane oxygenase PmoA